MAIAPTLRIGLATLTAFSLWLGPLTNHTVKYAGSSPTVAYKFDVRNQADRVLAEWALSRFDEAGLELPTLRIAFHDDKQLCNGNSGYYQPGRPASLDICGFNWNRTVPWAKRTMLHELGHAWVHHTVSEDIRRSFLDLRGLTAWAGDKTPWEEQGFEHAAEIISWALTDRGPMFTRMRDANPGRLAQAYLHLTGGLPFARVAEMLGRQHVGALRP